MSQIGKLLRLPIDQFWLLLKAAVLLAITRVVLVLLPYSVVRIDDREGWDDNPADS